MIFSDNLVLLRALSASVVLISIKPMFLRMSKENPKPSPPAGVLTDEGGKPQT